MTDKTETIWSGNATFDFSLKWWRFRKRYKQWKRKRKRKRWEEKDPEMAKMIHDEIDIMTGQLDAFLAWGKRT